MSRVGPSIQWRVPGLRRAAAAALVVGASALAYPIAPALAQGFRLEERVEFSMYGRVGLGWTPGGEFIHGRTLNLTGTSLGGRLEEGDYLEPSLKIHLLEPSKLATAAYADAVVTPAMWAKNGLFIGVTSNRFDETLAFELGEAYVTAGNVLTPGLKLWAGERFYRGTNVYLADYWYYNNLSAQGAGVQYGPVDVAVLVQTSNTEDLYNVDVDGDGVDDGEMDVRRQRTVLVGQYKQELGAHALHLLSELHVLPRATAELPDGDMVMPSDYGWVAGLKGHIDLGNGGSFNDLSVRYGRRIANGGRGGVPTWVTFGEPDADGRFAGAFGIEVVEHLLYNVSPSLALNAYGVLHHGRGGSGASSNRFTDYAVGAQSTLYLLDQLHLVNEASYQGYREGSTGPFGNALKLSLAPTVVPSGKRDVWARPHLRLFYTVAFYDDEAERELLSPYLQTVGPTAVGHYLGARVEWWL
jgi:maltoporin